MKSFTHQTYEAHLAAEHKISPISTYLKEIVYGGIDGIITTFAVVAGFSGAQTGPEGTIPMFVVLLFGFANLFGDASSMGLGNFLSVRADQDVYRKEQKKERHEIDNNPEFEIAETKHILTQKGFTTKQSHELAKIYATNPEYWTEFMMKDELSMPDPLDENPYLTGIITATSFMVFGAIPLIPYIFLGNVLGPTFYISLVFTGVALIILGLFRWKVTRQGFLRSVGETVLVGSISAGVAYLVGTFFRV
jgi:VIT1/CCC1 family predicted Fe2+/Mn2+ transporter